MKKLPSVICHLLFVICHLLFASSVFASTTWTETQKSDWSDGLTTNTTWYPETQLKLDWYGSGSGRCNQMEMIYDLQLRMVQPR